jgi:hypothetical protein
MPVEIAAGLVDLAQRERAIVWHERNHAGKSICDWLPEPAVDFALGTPTHIAPLQP